MAASPARPTRCYFDFAAGDAAAHATALAHHHSLRQWLQANADSYGLDSELDALDDIGRETLSGAYEGATQTPLDPLWLEPPGSLTLPRLHLLISSSPGLQKTTRNFLDLITDARALVSKRSSHPPLRYKGSKVHRIEEGFIAQGGDITRGDGIGGESIYGGKFPDEKEGLKTDAFQYGTLAMANSGKNSNTSQWFLTLCSTPPLLKKLSGKYVAFGCVDLDDEGSRKCLERLDELGNGKGGTRIPVWVADCGLVPSPDP